MSWRESKDAGKEAFAEGKYSEALTSYCEAIDLLKSEELEGSNGDGSHANEHQILLSNAIACRLKIGGRNMAEKALDEAKKVCFVIFMAGLALDMHGHNYEGFFSSIVKGEGMINNHSLVRVLDPPPT